MSRAHLQNKVHVLSLPVLSFKWCFTLSYLWVHKLYTNWQKLFHIFIDKKKFGSSYIINLLPGPDSKQERGSIDAKIWIISSSLLLNKPRAPQLLWISQCHTWYLLYFGTLFFYLQSPMSTWEYLKSLVNTSPNPNYNGPSIFECRHYKIEMQTYTYICKHMILKNMTPVSSHFGGEVIGIFCHTYSLRIQYFARMAA